VAKTNLQAFNQDWSKTVNWASQNKVPKPAVAAVYSLDAQRYANGEFPMSQAERSRAILTASNLDASTPLPTDNPSPTNVLGNAGHDLQNIFTGLMPTRLVANIWDGIKNTVEHPSEIMNPKDNTIMQWVPGWADLGMLKQGGWREVLSHPVVSFLDVLPVADLPLTVAAKAGLADSLASRAGITADQLAGRGAEHVGPVRLAGKLLSNTQTSKVGFPMGKTGFVRDADGNAIRRPLTVGERFRAYATSKGLGAPQSELNSHALLLEHSGSRLFRQTAEPFDQALAKLDGPQQAQLLQLLTSGKSAEEIQFDDTLPEAMKTAAESFQDGPATFFNEIAMSSDKYAKVRMPDTGKTEIYINNPADPVVKASKAADVALAAAEKKGAPADALAAQINLVDGQASPLYDNLQQLAPAIYQVIKGTDPLREQAETEAVAQFLRVDPSAVTLDQERMLDEIFSPGGLTEQLRVAHDRSDFKAYRAIALKLTRRFRSKALSPLQSPELARVADLSRELYEYSKYRARIEDQHIKAYDVAKQSQEAAARASKAFQDAVVKHPPARWQPAYLKALDDAYLAHDRANEVLDQASALLAEKGVPDSELLAARKDPTKVLELMKVHIRGTYNSPFADLVTFRERQELEADAADSVARARAQGLEPSWVPTISSFKAEERPSYAVRISSTRVPSVDAEFSRMMEPNNTVADIGAAVNHSISQFISRDMTADLADYLRTQFGVNGEELKGVVNRELKPITSNPDAINRIGFYENHFDQMGFVKYDPTKLFGIANPRLGGEEDIYIPKDIAAAANRAINENQFQMDSLFQRGTEVFRTSVLKFSPRFTAHIAFGGTFLLALRSSPYASKFIGDAYRAVKAGDHGDLADVLRRPTEYGTDEPVYRATQTLNYIGGKKSANMVIAEKIDKLGLDKTQLRSWISAAANVNYTFTRFVSNMQRAIAYFDGAAKLERQAGRHGYILDEAGNRIELTADRARAAGERAAEKVMGDVRKMTPLEQASFTKWMPFYGWTRHILRYVASYPMDHPYRASFLSNLANMNSEDTPSGLPTRIQLLFFFGSPNAAGNVTAVDLRALDPLRDTANYASRSGVLSSLNPAFTALPAMVDPELVFGNNVLYPTLTYSQLYGTREAAAAGGPLSAIEQYVPEVTALDAALGLSAQYRGLARSDPAAYAKTIFTSLGIPFANIQHLNLKQIAASNELSRYQVAAQAAQLAWETGNFSPLAGYPSVPDPLQPDYNVTPESLEKLYKSVLAQTGQPPAQVTPELPAPAV
jgi:hypothetical protein